MTKELGLESDVVRLIDYDDRWPDLFTAEARRLLVECEQVPVQLEHIGSTAIPGVCAKPVLDILAGRPPQAELSQYVSAFERAGYEHRGEQDIAGRNFFRRGKPRSYHIHLVALGGRLWREYLAFRDYLRTYADAAQSYADLKQALARQFPRDREAYIDGKGPFVQEVLQRAMGAA
jgi:GrpB-like predicted nucleotidyltransferase (UPF0157 family)